ncbi:uncharacterized protein LOC141633722 [Silene latifolia]|uniref:uncharacterized protein LOC141633722 n=1 Tax=Silene latifolia TaxID=37657 RepID=UPI003D77506F
MMEEGGWRKGPWTTQEDRLLIEYVKVHGEGRWNSVARLGGLRRNGKSCRLRWVNYLRPDLKRGQITPQEETIILELHARWGNRWSTIARSLPGRTDNEIKNYWRTHFKKKTKVSRVDTERSKTRLLRKQQFQQQQYYQLLQQQQPPQPQQQEPNDQFMTIDMKWMISLLLGDGEIKEAGEGPTTNTNPSSSCSSTMDQGGFYPTFNYSDGSTSEVSNDEMLLWNNNYGNVEDFQANNYWTSVCATSTMGVHPSIAPFC